MRGSKGTRQARRGGRGRTASPDYCSVVLIPTVPTPTYECYMLHVSCYMLHVTCPPLDSVGTTDTTEITKCSPPFFTFLFLYVKKHKDSLTEPQIDNH